MPQNIIEHLRAVAAGLRGTKPSIALEAEAFALLCEKRGFTSSRQALYLLLGMHATVRQEIAELRQELDHLKSEAQDQP